MSKKLNFDKIYKGTAITGDEAVQLYDIVTVDGKSLDLHNDLRNHSPDGFSWGYSGSGPAQLSLAILMDFTNDKELSLMSYQNFKFDIISKLPMGQNFVLTGKQIAEWFVSKEMINI